MVTATGVMFITVVKEVLTLHQRPKPAEFMVTMECLAMAAMVMAMDIDMVMAMGAMFITMAKEVLTPHQKLKLAKFMVTMEYLAMAAMVMAMVMATEAMVITMVR